MPVEPGLAGWATPAASKSPQCDLWEGWGVNLGLSTLWT